MNDNPNEQWKAPAPEAVLELYWRITSYCIQDPILSAPNKGRSVSMLPTVLMVIIP